MGFNRNCAAADVPLTYIVSQDTAIADAFDVEGVLSALDEDEAVTRYVDRVCGTGATDAQRAEARALIAQDDASKAEAVDLEKRRLIAEALIAEFPGEAIDRAKFDALPNLETLIASVTIAARKLRHKRYRETGNESDLGAIGDDVIRWRLRMLQPKERAEAKGRLSEQPHGVSQFAHYYNVNRWIVALVLTGADGWQDFAIDKKTNRATEQTIDAIDEDWIIELGDFILEAPTLRRTEKKA